VVRPPPNTKSYAAGTAPELITDGS
jgi:hypothetical protein